MTSIVLVLLIARIGLLPAIEARDFESSLLPYINIKSICIKDVTISNQDSTLLYAFFAYADSRGVYQLPIRDRISMIGRFFLNTPYRGGTLEGNSQEKLIVNLQAFDCVTFVDNVLALALTAGYSSNRFSQFLLNLQRVRYRNGKIDDYTSRLHYSTDWLYEMEQISLFKNVTPYSENSPAVNPVGFISSNHSLYPALKDKPLFVEKINKIEESINLRGGYYLAKEEIDNCPNAIKDGDVILITTSKKGLDTAHVGIAVEEDGEIKLLHASISAGKVVISEETLSEYMQKIESHTGIIIARILL